MLGKHRSKLLFAACSVVLASWGASSIANGAPASDETGFMMTSSTFTDGGPMPLRTMFPQGCNGQNLSPQLSWTNPPEGTKSYAITMIAEEGGRGIGTLSYSQGVGDVNLVAYGIPASVTSLARAASPGVNWRAS